MAEPNYDWIYKLQEQGPIQSTVTIKANPAWASLVTNRVKPYQNLPNKFRPALEAVGDYFRETSIPRVFKNEGPGWRQLSRRTQRERIATGYPARHPILQRTGDLFRELSEKGHPKHVEIVKVGQNSRIVIGGSSTKYVRNQLGNSTLRIPPRPMIPGTGWIPVEDQDRLAIQQILTQKIQEAINEDRARV